MIEKGEGNIPFIVGKHYHDVMRLYPDEIMYVSKGKRGSYIHIEKEKQTYGFEEKITSKYNVEQLYSILKEYGFEYAHNSYIVNFKFIKKKTATELELLDGTILSIARSKEKNFRLTFEQWIKLEEEKMRKFIR